MAEPGEILLGKYQVERELGRGGMGRVIAARHIDLGELVAIKLILPEFALHAEVVRRFMREARASAQIKSEHVCKVSDVGRLPSGEPYMVMEMLQGQDLEQLLEEKGPLPVADAIEYMMQAMEAIAEAHAAGIVHRDLKPANIFLTRRRNGTPCVKVLDFGISKLGAESATAGGGMTQTQGLLGSPLYMSPEQLESAKEVDGRADVWALGVILYQLLTRRLPFLADTLPQLIVKVLSHAPERIAQYRPDVPLELEAAIMHCLQKNRQARFANVGELATAIAPFGPASTALALHAIHSFPLHMPVAPRRTSDAPASETTLPPLPQDSVLPPLPATAVHLSDSAADGRHPGVASTLVAVGNTQHPLNGTASGQPRPRTKMIVIGATALVLIGAGIGIGASVLGQSERPSKKNAAEADESESRSKSKSDEDPKKKPEPDESSKPNPATSATPEVPSSVSAGTPARPPAVVSTTKPSSSVSAKASASASSAPIPTSAPTAAPPTKPIPTAKGHDPLAITPE